LRIVRWPKYRALVCHHDISTTKVIALVLLGASNYIIVHVISVPEVCSYKHI
jgi:hypothetical protein